MLASRPIPIYRLAGLAIVASQLLCVPSSAQPKAPTQPAGQPAAKAQAAANYGRTPLSFEANRGQTDPSVQFLSHGQGYMLFLRQGEAVLALRGGKPAGPIPASSAGSPGIAKVPPGGFDSSLVHMRLIGANPRAAVREEDRQITKTNYFIGKDPAKWRTGIPNYSRVRYSDVYPGIDLVYYGNQSRLEHDFVVAPGADPAHIQLALDGAERVRIDRDTGDLVLSTDSGELRLLKPVTYQESNGKRMPISSRYRLLADSRIGFTVGHFDHAQPLVIDPVLVYSTLLGGPGPATGGGLWNLNWGFTDDYPAMEWISAVAIDSTGSAYLAGETYSPSFPVTAGAKQSANGDAADSITGFVAKLDPTGSFLEYATYLGGSGGETCKSIAIDAFGDAYVAGVTKSTDFPVTAGAFQNANNDPISTSFVTELNPTGTALLYSTYLGGTGLGTFGDYACGIAVDSSGSAYVAGMAASKDFPVTKGAFQTVAKTQWNGFVTKLSPTGTKLIYSTYLSGSVLDFAVAIAVDRFGSVYLTGYADSPDFPVTKGAFQTTMPSSPLWAGYGSAFVTKLNTAGSGLVYSTFLGGTNQNFGDEGTAIAVDGSGEAYVTGQVSSFDFPVTKGAFQTTNKVWGGENSTSFVTKFNSDGSGLIYSTYLGGSSADASVGIAIDPSGNAYIAGSATSTDFPVTPNAFQMVNFSGNDVFLTELNSTGTALVYSSFFGGTADTFGNDIALDNSGNAYVAGTTSTAFPVSPSAFQTSASLASWGNIGFVTKLDLASAAGGIQSSTKLVVSPQTALVPITLTASVSAVGGGKTPAGNLDFRVDGQVVATVALNGSGGASYTSSALPGGAHTFAANYDGSSTYNPSSGDIYLTIPNPSLAAVSGMNQRAIYGVRFGAPLTVQLTDVSGENLAIPGIPVTFGGTGVNFASPTVMSDANGQAQAIGIAAQHGNVVATASIPNGANAAQFPMFCEKAELDVRPQYPQFPGQVLRYGDTIPTPTAYDLVGLVNGDTAATAVTGAPVMTIPATSTSPAGVYPIEIAKGTLAAANYNIGLQRGVLQIYRAPLTVTANNVTMTQGSAVPPLTYTLAGFLNGDTAAVVTGAPLLWTTATSSSPPGTYPIWVYRDTLSAPNYEFTAVDGTLTIQ
jgi:hypothetical protein